MFEKVQEFEWVRERYVRLIANVLKDKAFEVYDGMSVEDLENCDHYLESIRAAAGSLPLEVQSARKRPVGTYVDCAPYLKETLCSE